MVINHLIFLLFLMQKGGDWINFMFMIFKERISLQTLGAFLGGNLEVEFDFTLTVKKSLWPVGVFWGGLWRVMGEIMS